MLKEQKGLNYIIFRLKPGVISGKGTDVGRNWYQRCGASAVMMLP